MRNILKPLGVLMGVILYVVIYSLITAYPIMWLWNQCLVPVVSGLSVITFWKALGLRVLFGFLTFSGTYNKSDTPINNNKEND